MLTPVPNCGDSKNPFGLSLSMLCSYFAMSPEEGQPFDKLRANGTKTPLTPNYYQR
jgi:hypothetical protein